MVASQRTINDKRRKQRQNIASIAEANAVGCLKVSLKAKRGIGEAYSNARIGRDQFRLPDGLWLIYGYVWTSNARVTIFPKPIRC